MMNAKKTVKCCNYYVVINIDALIKFSSKLHIATLKVNLFNFFFQVMKVMC